MDTLMRSRTDRKIAGICGGLAQAQGWNATIIRLVWLVTVLFAGTGILLYVVLWVLLPEAPLPMTPRTGYAPVYPSTQPYYPAGGAPTHPPVPPSVAGPFAQG